MQYYRFHKNRVNDPVELESLSVSGNILLNYISKYVHNMLIHIKICFKIDSIFFFLEKFRS